MSDLDLTYLASTYHLTPGQIHGAVAQSRSADDPARPVLATTLLRAVKDGIAHRLGESARLVERAWTWEDLILTPPLRLQLEEFTHRFRLRDRVLGAWGLGRRFGDARGLSALFAKRTEVKSSNDRYANMEVNYLLQRLEAFTGVVVLTTNFGASIDDAFARRLSLRVTFPKPGAPERRALWRSMLQSGDLPLQSLDYDDLAARFEFAGGHIKNAVLRAAFLAAARDQPVTQDLIETAARLEMRAQGMLVLGDD